ncbi:hypothetical protein E4U54_003823, partial [Claviceps lovelessii]
VEAPSNKNKIGKPETKTKTKIRIRIKNIGAADIQVLAAPSTNDVDFPFMLDISPSACIHPASSSAQDRLAIVESARRLCAQPSRANNGIETSRFYLIFRPSSPPAWFRDSQETLQHHHV